MKRLIMMFMFVTALTEVRAQFFSQKTAQLRRLGEQVAALKVYGEFLGKGYKIANVGLNTIKDIKNGDFRLHDLFFDALQKVNPDIRRYAPVAKMVALQIATVRTAARAMQMARSVRRYGEQDLIYFERLFAGIVSACNDAIKTLSTFTGDGNIKLSDDERIVRIDQLYAQMQEHSRDATLLAEQIASVSLNKTHDLEEIIALKALHGIK